MEAEVFLLGHWKNFDELEEQLTLKELEAVRDAWSKQRHSDQKFMAALKGIDIDEGNTDEVSAEDLQRKADVEIARMMGQISEDTPDDVAEIGKQGEFGVGNGLGYFTDIPQL